MSTIKFAVIGCGHIGKRHAEMISRNEESTLLALVDVRPKEQLGLEAYDVPFFSSVAPKISPSSINVFWRLFFVSASTGVLLLSIRLKSLGRNTSLVSMSY